MNDHFVDRLDEYYTYLVEYNIATKDEIHLVTQINGLNEDTLNSILYTRTGYRSLEQAKEMIH